MGKNIIGGALGGGAFGRIGKILHMGRLGIGGEKIHINPAQEKEIIKRTEKVFGKGGRSPYEIKGRDIEKEVLNDLALRHVHGFDSKKAAEVEKALGLTEHTNQIGGKYSGMLKREKEAEKQERLNAAENVEVNKFEKRENRFGRLDNILVSVKGDKFAKNESGLGGMNHDKFAEKNMRPDGMSRNAPGQKTPDSHHGSAPMHETPIHGAPPSDIDD